MTDRLNNPNSQASEEKELQMQDLYKRLAAIKCEELAKKFWSLPNLLELSKSRKNPQVTGIVSEGIAKDFIRGFLPPQFSLKGGLIFDSRNRKTSPQIDAIIYKGVPLLQSADIVVVEKKLVKAICEIKSYIDQTALFGRKIGPNRDPNTGLVKEFTRVKDFLPAGAEYILFAFELWSSSPDSEVIKRLRELRNHYGIRYAIVARIEPRVERKKGKESETYDFDDSVSELIKWLSRLK